MMLDRLTKLVAAPAGAMFGVLLSATMYCQAPAVAPDEPVAFSQAHGATEILPAEALGADDLVELTVPYCAELSRTFRVGSDGRLALPLLSRKLQVAGMKPDELAAALQLELEQEHILINPTVSVSVLEYRSRPVSVMGAVVHPLTFQATGRTTLLDALARAGGMSTVAGGDIILTEHAVDARTPDHVQVIPARGLLDESDPKYNIVLHGGEEIRVPEASKIFVTGNVHHPGMYPMQGDSDTTVMKAIALSQGLDSFSAHTAYIYRRHNATADRDELVVPLNRIMSRKSPDMALKPDDILYIPDATGRRMTSRVISQITGFGQTAGSGLLIYR
ncbi:polysaccharide biosynthesis/export family protein [Granulicella arctica]|uniref:Polysaccharide export outer membrane protein n=1 Tax=Granulicella arctica TaxID=940613 RepID=A0A7Y9PHN4_9BACT|nr:polysaccharide biosynthesis/export family protein [Granulicella arctica]NYF79920.1 polysaccharide export outer membrane protein [Granulicella arctica]